MAQVFVEVILGVLALALGMVCEVQMQLIEITLALKYAHNQGLVVAPFGLQTYGEVDYPSDSVLTRITLTGGFFYSYQGSVNEDWWDNYAVWNPFAIVAWDLTDGAYTETKKPVLIYKAVDPDASPKPSWEQIESFYDKWSKANAS